MVTLSRTTLLLIDDSTTELRLLMEMLASRNFRIVVAFDGNDGYRKALLNRPDLILLDVKMPGTDGFTACRLLKATPETRHIPVIFLTAVNEPEQRVEGLTLGAVDYVTKPFSEREVLARVGLHLDIARRLSNAENPRPDPARAAGGSPDATLVRAATTYLADRLGEPPAPGELARILGTNEKRLNDAFRQQLGLPVFAYVREERMRQARQLLASTDIPVGTIGEHVGYTSPANFATAFRNRFGISPREFRQSLRDREWAEAAAGTGSP